MKVRIVNGMYFAGRPAAGAVSTAARNGVERRADGDSGEPSWSERRRYCRDEYDDSTGSWLIEVAVARACSIVIVIVIGVAVWFA